MYLLCNLLFVFGIITCVFLLKYNETASYEKSLLKTEKVEWNSIPDNKFYLFLESKLLIIC